MPTFTQPRTASILSDKTTFAFPEDDDFDLNEDGDFDFNECNVTFGSFAAAEEVYSTLIEKAKALNSLSAFGQHIIDSPCPKGSLIYRYDRHEKEDNNTAAVREFVAWHDTESGQLISKAFAVCALRVYEEIRPNCSVIGVSAKGIREFVNKTAGSICDTTTLKASLITQAAYAPLIARVWNVWCEDQMRVRNDVPSIYVLRADRESPTGRVRHSLGPGIFTTRARLGVTHNCPHCGTTYYAESRAIKEERNDNCCAYVPEKSPFDRAVYEARWEYIVSRTPPANIRLGHCIRFLSEVVSATAALPEGSEYPYDLLRAAGEELNTLGGLPAMQTAIYAMAHIDGYRVLSDAFDGIGDFQI
jgi:hypothetical protein